MPMRRESWGTRDHCLNGIPVLGSYTTIPSSLSDKLLCDMLTREWMRACKVLCGLVLKEPTHIASHIYYMMSVPGERTKVGTH